jgi:hypothetical protein
MRLLRLTDDRARRTADGGSDWTSHDGSGDCAGRSALLDGVAASGQCNRGNCDGGGGEDAFHGSSSRMVKLNVFRLTTVPQFTVQVKSLKENLMKTIVSGWISSSGNAFTIVELIKGNPIQ